MSVLNEFLHSVDWSGRHEDSCGRMGQGRPRRRLSAEEAPRTARGKRSASRQAKTACPCGDYSKKLSLVERKSTDHIKTAKPKNVDEGERT